MTSRPFHLRQKDDPALTAIAPANYKFSYKGVSRIGDRLVHAYQVKPQKKRMGLFKGRIYLDAQTGSLVRVEGSVIGMGEGVKAERTNSRGDTKTFAGSPRTSGV